MRFLRFNYILPRLFLLFVLLLVTEVASGYLARWGLIAAGESAIGAKVEIGQVETSLLKTRLLINDLAVANPNSPMKNLFEFERMIIDFDSSSLLRKKMIADYGIVRGLTFGTPRENSGELPESPAEPESLPKEDWLSPEAKQQAVNWLANLETRFSTDVHEQLQSVRLAEEMSARWPDKYRQLEAAARAIKADSKILKERVDIARKNPLRNLDFLASLPQETAKLRRSLRDLQAEMAALPAQIEADRAAVLAARVHDEKLIRDSFQLDNIDAQSLSNYLIGEQIAGPVGETIAWIRWARKMVPARSQKRLSISGRGEDVQFAGTQPLPNLLIRGLRLEGSARLGGQPVELAGMLRDWTTQPDLHSRPTTLELTTSGSLPMTVRATLDRTSDIPHDTFVVNSNGLVMPKLSLGDRGPLRLAVAPSTATLSMNLQLQGDQLVGDLQIVQQGLNIQPKISSNLLGGKLQTALAESVSSIDSSTTQVTFVGTLDAPKMQFSSTLGTELAEAIQQAATLAAKAEGDRLLASSQQKVDAQLAKFSSELQQFQSKLAADLAQPGEIIASLLGQRGDQEPQIGRSPFGKIFK